MCRKNFYFRQFQFCLYHACHSRSGEVALCRSNSQHTYFLSVNKTAVKALLCGICCHLSITVCCLLLFINCIMACFNFIRFLNLDTKRRRFAVDSAKYIFDLVNCDCWAWQKRSCAGNVNCHFAAPLARFRSYDQQRHHS